MNETITLLKNRKSVRKYTDQPLPDSVKKEILEAALCAPSAGAMMLYSIIEVEDQSLKEKLAVSCDHQPFIARAPYVLLFLADYQRWFDYYQFSDAESACADFSRKPRLPAEGDFLLACMDALIAAQNAVIAAESLSVGSCYIGDIIERYEEHKILFNLPRWTAPIALLCFGYPTPDQKSRSKPVRFDLRYIVHKDTYRQFSDQEFSKMWPDSHRETAVETSNPMSRLNHGQHNYIRKFTADFSLEMTRSAREILKNWQNEAE